MKIVNFPPAGKIQENIAVKILPFYLIKDTNLIIVTTPERFMKTMTRLLATRHTRKSIGNPMFVDILEHASIRLIINMVAIY
jgi:hypothetical protein